jgi:hypothetical protein
MLAWQALADVARRELSRLDLCRRSAAGFDWRGFGGFAVALYEQGVESRNLGQ